MNKVTIEGVELTLSHPDRIDVDWVGGEDLIRQLGAAWLRLGERDLPMNPRLLGKPGVGKTTLAYVTARRMGREVYIFQSTMDTRPEDLIVTPVISADGKIQYHASSLVTAMLTGQVCIMDEGNRMSEKSWASLAPLLDDRRYVESIVAGIKIPAHPDFLICVTMNDDASTYEVPEYIHSRIQPSIYVGFPDYDEERRILKNNFPFADDEILDIVTGFLQRAHEYDEAYTVRDGINILRFAVKLLDKGEGKRSSDNAGFAVDSVLGSDALRYLDPDYEPQMGDDPLSFLDDLTQEGLEPDDEDDF
ncbi:MAG TPA: MoxR family ATPase [bacterium]|nr:MoxR family ATPase [bacterium]